MNVKVESPFIKLISLLNEVESIVSSDKIQKMVFILKNEGVPFNEKYKYYPVGPYSSDLQLEVIDLIERNFFKTDGNIPQTIKINIRFKLEDDPDISEKKELIKFLKNLDIFDLEIISTIYYLLDLGYMGENQIKKKIKILKPSLSKKLNSGYTNYEKIKENYFG
ncbi:hypothetical protein ES705_13333 [subsurface metagenome]